MSQANLFNLMPERRVWKVSELNAHICELLEGTLPDIWLEGEVSNYRPAQSGHLYFTLKDAQSQIRCVCFRDQARGLKFRPQDGLSVTVRGALSVYEPRGEYQIYVSHIEPVGAGALQVAFEQLKKRLADEGLFDESRKKSLPLLPRSIGVVTSPTGAAILDILRVLKRRFSNAHVMLYPVQVQGDFAAREVVAALRYFNRVKSVEVIIVARGGGSLEDLWAFNEEVLVRAIVASEIAVITGIGHESDFTIADFVADLRAPTPSAAAEIVVRSRQEFENHLSERSRRLVHQMRFYLSELRHRSRDLQTHRAFRQLELFLRRRRQQIDESTSILAMGLQAKFVLSRQRLAQASSSVASFDLRSRGHLLRRHMERDRDALQSAFHQVVTRKGRQFTAARLQFAALDLRARVGRLRRTLDQDYVELQARAARALVAKRRRLEAAALQLGERSPVQLLERGYAIAYDAEGKVLRSVEQVARGEDISVRLARGELRATVRSKKVTKP